MAHETPEIVDVEFTKDMITTLADTFSKYAVDGVVTLQMTPAGLFLYHRPTDVRQFLGAARLPKDRPVFCPITGGVT